ncbi:MAG: VWA domain-containing protein [Erysipelotrichaceae bacterium]|nr:VWA domain-containing protein [Erysipelotrichaceae bacterium]MBR2702349.1 VWA domain-containing protein [Erysipelotrichaceae bacterium]
MKTTEVIFILDRSGSMSGLESDTIGGYNSILKQQREMEGDVNVTTVLFDDRYELLHNRESIRNVSDLTAREYYVRGCTALVDAMGITISRFIKEVSDEKVMFVITTDGYENASREYTVSAVKKMIETQKEKGWEFIFMGANIDAVATGSQFGIARNRNYVSDSSGVAATYSSLRRAVKSFVENSAVDEKWDEEVKSDYSRKR